MIYNPSRSRLHVAAAVGDEGIEDSVQVLLISWIELTLLSDLLQKPRVTGPQVGQELSLEFRDLGSHHLVEVASHTSEDHADLFLSHHWHLSRSIEYELLLLEELGELGTSVEELLGGSVQIGTELGEGCDLSVLGELEF